MFSWWCKFFLIFEIILLIIGIILVIVSSTQIQWSTINSYGVTLPPNWTTYGWNWNGTYELIFIIGIVLIVISIILIPMLVNTLKKIKKGNFISDKIKRILYGLAIFIAIIVAITISGLITGAIKYGQPGPNTTCKCINNVCDKPNTGSVICKNSADPGVPKCFLNGQPVACVSP